VVRATLDGLANMNSPEMVAAKRGKSVEDILGMTMAKTIKITQTRSSIGRLPKHKATLLGLVCVVLTTP
jgi:hypothetical protein